MDIRDFKEQMNTKGWCKFSGVYSEALVDQVLEEMKCLEDVYAPIQKEAGVYERTNMLIIIRCSFADRC